MLLTFISLSIVQLPAKLRDGHGSMRNRQRYANGSEREHEWRYKEDTIYPLDSALKFRSSGVGTIKEASLYPSSAKRQFHSPSLRDWWLGDRSRRTSSRPATRYLSWTQQHINRWDRRHQEGGRSGGFHTMKLCERTSIPTKATNEKNEHHSPFFCMFMARVHDNLLLPKYDLLAAVSGRITTERGQQDEST